MYEVDRTATAAIPIGNPVSNLKLKVMLPNRREAPNGIKGEAREERSACGGTNDE